jgi:glycosyltransferase involved in cell wall biosynthesis
MVKQMGSGQRSGLGQPRAVIWKKNWLPGSETFVANQVNSLTRWQALLVGEERVQSPLGVEPQVILRDGRNRTAGVHKSLLRLTGYDPRLHRVLTARDIQLAHAHFGSDGSLLAWPARYSRKPLIVTFHGFDATGHLDEPDARVYRLCFRRLKRSPATYVAVSEFIRGRLVSLGLDRGRIHVIPIGIPVPAARRDGNGPRRDGILFVGRLTEKKGVEDLLEAASAVSPRPRLTIAGDGPLRRPLERRAARLRVRAEFVGSQPPAAVSSLMTSHRVFCAPSKRAPNGDSEGLGMVFLEAAAHQLPVVAYRHGGVPEAVLDGETGLLAPENDRLLLTSALQRVLDDPGLAVRLGRAGRRWVEERYDIAKCTPRLENLYDSVASERMLACADGGRADGG